MKWQTGMLLAALGIRTVAAAPALTPSDQAAIMKALCTDELKKDEKGWVCVEPPVEEGGDPVERRWLTARRGRFVVHPDEWLVSIDLGCGRMGCEGDTHVFRKLRGRWRRTHTFELFPALGDNCTPFGGMPDGLERLVCLDFSGPHQGFMSQRVAVLSFAGGEPKVDALTQKDRGGECFLERPGPEHKGDVLTVERGKPTDTDVAFTVRLEMRRAPCVGPDSNDDGHGPMTVKGTHVLRFIRRGNDVVPDSASGEIIAAEDWAPRGDL